MVNENAEIKKIGQYCRNSINSKIKDKQTNGIVNPSSLNDLYGVATYGVFPRREARFDIRDPLLGGSIFNLSVRALEGVGPSFLDSPDEYA